MYEIKVSEMTCGGCASSIRHVLEKVDPLVDVKIDLKSQIVMVKSSQQVDAIANLIEEAGFPVLSKRVLN